MGRAFEFRRARKERRWGRMAVAFTKLSKEITLAVKKAGPDPGSNIRLRIAIEEAKSANMPKDKVDAAIKRALARDIVLEEVVYEGYGPHGVAIVVETATDNPTRTVGNIRNYFSRAHGTLGTSGSLDFLFERKGIIRIDVSKGGLDQLELDLIDFGLEDLIVENNEGVITTSFNNFVPLQKVLAERQIPVLSAQVQRLPLSTVELPQQEMEDVLALIEKLEDDEDVQAVYHTLQ